MNFEELKQAIKDTKFQINVLKAEVEGVSAPRNKKKLEHRLLNLRVLQLWQMEQYENLGGNLIDLND
ncbi:hypothetical protein [Desulfolucanica intricata]|uniref:hypothetical protein n=1 Tax=Desulfolucanica intricata TaxID=1285191 RepID=UPI0008318564|nr:hypothetical protein [Desulfolucanica intricata]